MSLLEHAYSRETMRSCKIVAQGNGSKWDGHAGKVTYPFSEFKSWWFFVVDRDVMFQVFRMLGSLCREKWWEIEMLHWLSAWTKMKMKEHEYRGEWNITILCSGCDNVGLRERNWPRELVWLSAKFRISVYWTTRVQILFVSEYCSSSAC